MEAEGDGRLAESGAAELVDAVGVQGRCEGPTQSFTVLPGVSQTGAHPLAQNLAFKLGKYGQQSRHSPTGRRGQVQRFSQRDETDAQVFQFL